MSAPLLSMTSKTSSLKALLLRAWRERWSDLQWGIHIKTILPRGVSGDVYNLADCILQQALVGPGPNQLVVSYLKHSLSSQLVSYAAVLQRISKYDGFHKPHCIISLLEFLETIQGGITCRSKPEEGLLAAAVLSIVQWLLTCMQHALKNLPELRSGNADHMAMMDKPGTILDAMMKCDFMVAMLYLAKHECRDVYHEVVKKCQDVETLLNQSLPYQPNIPVADILRKLSHLEMDGDSPDKTNDNSEPVTYCLQALLAIEVLLNPSSDTQVFVNELLMVQRLKGYNMARLYCEVMRACFISLNDVFSTSKESQWIAFTFLKLPHILRQLHITVRGESPDSQEKGDFSQDVVDSFDLLLQYTPLLDNMDAKCSCNCLECLLKELLKIGLVTEAHVKHYSSKRENTISALQRLDVNPSPSLPVPKVVVRAEPTLASVLKTLDADYTEEKLLGMLCQVLTGKSFELIIAVAAVDGKLRTFFNKLIKVNQSSRQIKDKEDKAAHARAILFDVTFLMLCYIVHTYGSEAVLSEEGGSSFFEQWVRECMVERGRPKSPDQILQHCDQSRVDALLTQFNSPDGDVTTSQVKWHEMCFHVPAAIKEVLLAWEHGSVSANDVKRNLDAMRSRMCCLPVCAAAWLCSYMQILHQDALLKPMNMVQQFLTQPSSEEISQQDNFKERFGLMCQIIRKMQYDVHPPTQSKVKVMTLSHSIISRQPISEQLEAVWVGIQGRGWVNIEATHSLESLLNTGGSHWFVTNLVKEVLRFRYQEDLDRAVDLAFAVFHLDIEHCTLALLLHVLPQYLHNRLLSEELVEPQASALAKLCAYCVFAALEFQNNSNSGQSSNRKRSRRDMEGEDLDGFCPSAKFLRLTSSVSESPDASSLFGTATPTSQNTSSSRSYGNQLMTVREPLQSALNDLFNTFTTISGRDGEVSQQTHFVCRFLQFVVQCGRDRTRLVLQGMPNTLVPCLLRSLPDLFTTELLLKLYDIQTVVGRKVTARDLCMLRNMSLKDIT